MIPIREYELEADDISTTWFVVSVKFPTVDLARRGWERIREKMSDRNLDIGVYRHGTTEEPGVWLTIVSDRKTSVLACRRELHGADDHELELDKVQALILRRLRKLVDHPDGGSEVIRRPDGRGGYMYPDGTVFERIGRG